MPSFDDVTVDLETTVFGERNALTLRSRDHRYYFRADRERGRRGRARRV